MEGSDLEALGSLESFVLSLAVESRSFRKRHDHHHHFGRLQYPPLGGQANLANGTTPMEDAKSNPIRMPRDLVRATTEHMIRHADRKLNKQRERLCNTAKGRELPECLTTSTTFLSSTPTASTSITSPVGGGVDAGGFGFGALYNVSTTMTIPSPYLPNCSEELINAVAGNATLSTACNNIFANGELDPTDPFECGPECWPAPFGTLLTIFIAVSLAFCIVITTFGNLLVLVSFVVDRQIRQPTNFFIASLAVTDVLIGTVSMPFYTVYVLVGYWPAELGPILCDLWLSVDYTVCLVSQFTVLLITVDRFCSVKIAARYRAWRTGGKVMVMIVTTWIIAALLFFVSIFGWEHFIGYRDLRPGECMVQFLKDPIFNTSLIIGYYWIPLTILCVLYSFIFEAAWTLSRKSQEKEKERQKLLALAKKPASGATGASNTAVGIAAVAMTASLATSKPSNGNGQSKEPPKESDINEGSSSSPSVPNVISMKSAATFKVNGDAANEIERASTVNEDDPSSAATGKDTMYNAEESSISGSKKDIMRKIGKRIRFRKRKKDKFRTENRARKALRTISIILGAFVACWTPYHILAIIASFRPEAVNVHLYMFSYFLCYANSPINPFCYAASNQQFKNAFKRIMRGDLSMK
eukprot:maker-scaffold109_size355148-snap-gene-1.25 protein:Tk11033 transcript:maker-scaffold109_size355148-snap-gene-1.25-mRNA-1 annotation:"muscarinic acetylcholine receptor m1"